jgi:hypothetical protein
VGIPACGELVINTINQRLDTILPQIESTEDSIHQDELRTETYRLQAGLDMIKNSTNSLSINTKRAYFRALREWEVKCAELVLLGFLWLMLSL